MTNYTIAQTEAAIAALIDTADRTHFGFETAEEAVAAQIADDDLTIGSTLDADRGHSQRYLRGMDPWALICEFFHYSGCCYDLMTDGAFYAIGSLASGYVENYDWSFIRDCDDQEREAVYLALCLHIRTKRLASKTYRALLDAGKLVETKRARAA